MSKATFDMFDVSINNIKDTTTTSIDQDLYKPTPESGRNGTYASIVRFIPFWKDTHNPIIKKWTIFLEDPVSGKKRTVDCPSSVGEKSVLRDLFFKYWNSNSVREKELANKFKRKQTCYSLVYIVKDENNPDLEGKIMVFKFGQKILEKIINEMSPKIGKERKPFDPFNGRPFSIIVSKKGGYTNYDESYFLDEPWPLKINGEHIDRESTDPNDILNWLKETSPDLSKYEYKKWDDQMAEFVNEAIRNTVPNGKVVEEVLNMSKSKSKSSDDFDNTPSSKSSSVTKTSAKSLNIEEDISSSKNDDDISFDDDDDDFYSGLDDE
jgi:hypothetical protein